LFVLWSDVDRLKAGIDRHTEIFLHLVRNRHFVPLVWEHGNLVWNYAVVDVRVVATIGHFLHLVIVVNNHNVCHVAVYTPLIVWFYPRETGLFQGEHIFRDCDSEAFVVINARLAHKLQLEHLVVRLHVYLVLMSLCGIGLEINVYNQSFWNFVVARTSDQFGHKRQVTFVCLGPTGLLDWLL